MDNLNTNGIAVIMSRRITAYLRSLFVQPSPFTYLTSCEHLTDFLYVQSWRAR
jgi:hypothetical protein